MMSSQTSCTIPTSTKAAAAARPKAERPGRHAMDGFILALSTATLVGAFVLQYHPERSEQVLTPAGRSIHTVCWIRAVTGVSCPTCGLTRSFVALAHGQWGDAWRSNHFGLLVFLLVAAQIPYRLVAMTSRRRESIAIRLYPLSHWPVVLVALMAADWLIRQLGRTGWPSW
jgi:hypothetical protein